MEGFATLAVIVGLVLIIWLAGTISELGTLKDRGKSLTIDNNNLVSEIKKLKQDIEEKEKSIIEREEKLEKERNLFQKIWDEKTEHFPIIGKIWASLSDLSADVQAEVLETKKRPAPKAAEEVQKIKREKRQLIKDLNLYKNKAMEYEQMYPWLEDDMSDEITDESILSDDTYYGVYNDEEREDAVSAFLKPEEYRKLPRADRNQLALDRYWLRRKRTKWQIGMTYERYIGYKYESEGWRVDFSGIRERFEDRGRDLVCRKGDTIEVVQCKMWSKYKVIRENAIFQLFGTTYALRKENRDKNVVPVFYTSTKMSEIAKAFSKALGIKIEEECKFEEYPSIKCNISVSGEKIYHLPMDQQYDKVQIESEKGEFYAKTIKEAEKAGFRRAYRWKGLTQAE